MKKNLLINIAFLVLISTFFACELMPSKNDGLSDANLSTTIDSMWNLKQVFAAQDGSSGDQVDDYAKDFEYTDGNGTTHQLSDFRGQKVVLIKLWSIACKGCVETFGEFDAVHDTYKDSGLLALALNVSTSETAQDIARVVYKYDFQNVYNANPYLIGNLIPLYLLINKNGIIKFKGYTLPDASTINNLLN